MRSVALTIVASVVMLALSAALQDLTAQVDVVRFVGRQRERHCRIDVDATRIAVVNRPYPDCRLSHSAKIPTSDT